jgi:phosphoserine phosphatase
MTSTAASLPLTSLPLCVDMDDTLIHTDVLMLGIQQLVCTKPWLLLWFIAWLCIQRAAAKAWLARIFPLDAQTLPYRTELVDYLKIQKSQGRKLFLVSAADERIVKSVARFMDLFDAAYGSDGKTNLKGSAKAAFIQSSIGTAFVYAGDSFADLLVWKVASGAILCGKAQMFKSTLPIPVEASFA